VTSAERQRIDRGTARPSRTATGTLGSATLGDRGTAVTTLPITSVQLPPAVSSVPAARSCTTAALQAWGFAASLLDDVALLLTELTANAVRHGHGLVSVEVDLDGDRLLVRVRDEEDAAPRLQHAGAQDEGGRGLWLVDAIAERWGWESVAAGGKSVWFQLTATPAAMDGSASVA
jgi:anti-sigma regulatory factor (Ser/Thr protein kinase)